MRIVVAVNAPSRHLFPLFLCWQTLGHQVHIVVGNGVGRLGCAETYRQQGLSISILQRRRTSERDDDSISVREFAECISSADALVVGGYSTRTALVSLLISRRKRPPTVLLAERPDHRTTGVRRLVRDRIVRWVISRTDAVWAISTAGRNWYQNLSASVTLVAPYPMPSLPGSHLPCRKTREQRSLVISVIGALTEGKNPLAAASTFRELNELGVSFEAAFYGEGPLRPELTEAVQGLPVRLAGQVPEAEIVEALRYSDILLHPSLYDGWGMVVAEAVMLCTGVVAGPGTDSACEFARFGSTVRVVDPTPDNLAREIVSIAERVSSPTWMEELREMKQSALRFAGVHGVAERTCMDLENRVTR